jgi:AraC-like DNA-binding protein/mannose-6-phosphate isomerase-like protein (cupin superfamily)
MIKLCARKEKKMVNARKYNNVERSDYTDVNCHLWQGTQVKAHAHADYYEINVFTDGEATTLLNGKEFSVKKGDVIIMAPGTFHEIYSKGISSHYNVALRAEYFSAILSSKPFLQNVLSAGFTIFSLSSHTLTFVLSKIPFIDNEQLSGSSMTLCEAIIYAVLSDTVQNVCGENGSKNKITYYVKDAINKIDNGKYLDKSVAQIIATYPISAPSFVLHFKKITGFTPQKYLLEKKLSHAKKLLRTTSMTILEISLAVGFDSISHFIKVFKSKYDFTPLALRKNAEKNGKIFAKDHVLPSL